MSGLKFLYPCLLALTITSCKNQQNTEEEGADRSVARVYNKVLYYSELEGLTGINTSPQDSALKVERYINSWIRKNLLLNEAEKLLSEKEKDVEQQLTDYRNSLLIYAYEKELITRMTDTVVTNKSIENYYEANKRNFELRSNILRGRYIKLELKSDQLDSVQAYVQSNDSAILERLKNICYHHALSYVLNDTIWYLFDDFFNEIPLKVYNQESFLRNNKAGTISDSLYDYVYYINDVRIQKDISPLSFVYDNIKQIILNKKGLSMLDSNYINIYQEALQKRNFEIY